MVALGFGWIQILLASEWHLAWPYQGAKWFSEGMGSGVPQVRLTPDFSVAMRPFEISRVAESSLKLRMFTRDAEMLTSY